MKDRRISAVVPSSRIKNALVLRTARTEQLLQCLNKISENWPECEITVVAQSSAVADVSRDQRVRKTISIPDKPVSILDFPMFEVLRGGPYDLLVVLYNDTQGLEYFHVDSMSTLIQARHKVIFDVEGWYRPFPSDSTGAVPGTSERAEKLLLGMYTRTADKALMLSLARAALRYRAATLLAKKAVRTVKTANLKIVHVLSGAGIGGIQRHIHYLIKHRSEAFSEVHVICFPTDEKYFLDMYRESGAKIHFIFPEPASAVRYSEITLHLFNLLGKIRPHILNNWMFDMGLCGAIAGSFAMVPVIVDSVQISPDYVEDVWMPISDSSNLPFVQAIKTAAKIPDRAIANAIYLKREFEKWTGLEGAEKVAAVHNGIDVSAFESPVDREKERAALGITADAPVAGIVGRIAKEKDHETFFRMAAIVARNVPEAKFLVVGFLPQKEEVDPAEHFSHLLESLGIAGRVVFTGKSHRIREMLAVMDVAVSSSIMEGFSNYILEAMAAGLPVVATDVSGSPEAVEHGHTGYIVPPGKPEALADYVIKLFKNTAQAREMGDAARRRAKDEFNVMKMVRSTEKIYLELCK